MTNNRKDEEVPESASPQDVTALRRRIKSQQKMILGMAMARYDYDRRATRNKATGAIAGDLTLAGLSLDEETILGHLREAAKLLTEV